MRRTDGFWESRGQHVKPRSLYIQQLRDRLGERAVANVTIPEQIEGPIADLVRERLSK